MCLAVPAVPSELMIHQLPAGTEQTFTFASPLTWSKAALLPIHRLVFGKWKSKQTSLVTAVRGAPWLSPCCGTGVQDSWVRLACLQPADWKQERRSEVRLFPQVGTTSQDFCH